MLRCPFTPSPRLAAGFVAKVLSAAVLVTALCSAALAQGAAGPLWLLSTTEDAAGGRATSSLYTLEASFGAGVVAGRAAAGTYTLTGGFSANLDAGPDGRPWLMGCDPCFAPPVAGTRVALRGTALDAGTNPVLRVASANARIVTRSPDRVVFESPDVARPGWTRVELATSAGTTSLERGLAILPLVDGQRAAVNGLPFTLDYRGKQHDFVVWFAATRRAATPLALPPLRHVLELDPASLVTITATFVSRADGQTALSFPAGLVLPRVYFQALVLTEARDYYPGSFTNVFER